MLFCIVPTQTPHLFFLQCFMSFASPIKEIEAATSTRKPVYNSHVRKGTHTMDSTRTQQDCVFVYVIPLSQEGVILNVLPSNRMQSHITQTVLLYSLPYGEDKYHLFSVQRIHSHYLPL